MTDLYRIVEEFVHIHAPTCALAVWGGSASRGQATPHSDLDVVVYTPCAQTQPMHRTYTYKQWTIEQFVLDDETYPALFAVGVQQANPTLQRMICEGVVVVSRGDEAKKICAEAEADLAYGPLPWTNAEIDHARYVLTTCWDDIQSIRSTMERWIVAGNMLQHVCVFRLRTCRQWIAEGKHLWQRFSHEFPHEAIELDKAWNTLGEMGDVTALGAYVQAVLHPHGGWLREGYAQ